MRENTYSSKTINRYDAQIFLNNSSMKELENSVIKYGNVIAEVDVDSKLHKELNGVFGSDIFQVDGKEHVGKVRSTFTNALYLYKLKYIGSRQYICSVSIG